MSRSIIFVMILLGSCSASTAIIVEENSPVVQGGLLIESTGTEASGGLATLLLNSGCKLPCEVSQVFSIQGEGKFGVQVKEVCRKHGMSNATCCNWKTECGGMNISEQKRTRELEAKSAKLKRMYADYEAG